MAQEDNRRLCAVTQRFSASTSETENDSSLGAKKKHCNKIGVLSDQELHAYKVTDEIPETIERNRKMCDDNENKAVHHKDDDGSRIKCAFAFPKNIVMKNPCEGIVERKHVRRSEKKGDQMKVVAIEREKLFHGRGEVMSNEDCDRFCRNTTVSKEVENDETLNIFSSPFRTLAESCGFKVIKENESIKTQTCSVFDGTDGAKTWNVSMQKSKDFCNGDNDTQVKILERSESENETKHAKSEPYKQRFSRDNFIGTCKKNTQKKEQSESIHLTDRKPRKYFKEQFQLKNAMAKFECDQLRGNSRKQMEEIENEGSGCKANLDQCFDNGDCDVAKEQNVVRSAFKQVCRAGQFDGLHASGLRSQISVLDRQGVEEKLNCDDNSHCSDHAGSLDQREDFELEEDQTTSVSKVASNTSQSTTIGNISDWTIDAQEEIDPVSKWKIQKNFERNLTEKAEELHYGADESSNGRKAKNERKDKESETQQRSQKGKLIEKHPLTNLSDFLKQNQYISDTVPLAPTKKLLKGGDNKSFHAPLSKSGSVTSLADETIAPSELDNSDSKREGDASNNLCRYNDSEDICSLKSASSENQETAVDDELEEDPTNENGAVKSQSCSTQTPLSISSPTFSLLTTLTSKNPFGCGIDTNHSSSFFENLGLWRGNTNVNNAESGCGTSFVGHYLFELWKNQCLCDIRIRVGNSSYLAHTIVLAAFSDLFCGDPQAMPTQVFDVHDATPEAVHQILLYLYTSEMEIKEDSLESVLNAAKNLGVTEIVKLCEEILKNPTLQNLEMYMEIRKRHGMPGTLLAFPDIYREHFKEITSCKYFLELSIEELEELLADTEIKVESEAEMIYAIANWIEFEPLERTEMASRLLQLVKFECMCPDELATAVDTKKFIFDYEATTILMDAFKDLAVRYGNDSCKEQKAEVQRQEDLQARLGAEAADSLRKRFAMFYDGDGKAYVKEMGGANRRSQTNWGNTPKKTQYPAKQSPWPTSEDDEFSNYPPGDRQRKHKAEGAGNLPRRFSTDTLSTFPTGQSQRGLADGNIYGMVDPQHVGQRQTCAYKSRFGTGSPSRGYGGRPTRKTFGGAHSNTRFSQPFNNSRLEETSQHDIMKPVLDNRIELLDESLDMNNKRFNLKEGVVIDIQDNHQRQSRQNNLNAINGVNKIDESRMQFNSTDNHPSLSNWTNDVTDASEMSNPKCPRQVRFSSEKKQEAELSTQENYSVERNRVAARVSELLSKPKQQVDNGRVRRINFVKSEESPEDTNQVNHPFDYFRQLASRSRRRHPTKGGLEATGSRKKTARCHRPQSASPSLWESHDH